MSIFSLALIVCKGQSDLVILQDQNTLDELIMSSKNLPETAIITTLSTIELEALLKLLNKCVTGYNFKTREGFRKRGERKKYARMYCIMNLRKYKFQLVPYLNGNGEKEVWINGFCSQYHDDWRTKIVDALDGGNCYFTVLLNITNNKCLVIGTNGYA